MDTQLRLLPPLDDLAPTVTASDRLATELLDAIVDLAARVPRLEAPHPATASRVRGARTVSREFLTSMIAAVEDERELQAIGTFDAAEARETLRFNDAFRHVADRLEALAANIRYTMASRKARVAFEAMRTYAIARGLARDEENTPLVHHLTNLRRDLARTSRRPLTSSASS